MKSVLRGKLIPLSTSKRKLERAHTNSLTAQLNGLEQKEANTPKRSRLQKIIKFSAKINQIKTKELYKESTKQGAGSLKKFNKIDKPLARLTIGHRDSIQINKIKN